MELNNKKIQAVINNYFELDCADAIPMTIKTAYSLGFHRAIERFQTAYTQPKAYWVIMMEKDADNNIQCECSNCHHGDLQAEDCTVPYCWHCGAQMQGRVTYDDLGNNT